MDYKRLQTEKERTKKDHLEKSDWALQQELGKQLDPNQDGKIFVVKIQVLHRTSVPEYGTF